MNHLDDLRDALDSPPDFTAPPMDLTSIMRAGGRIRRRRRMMAGAVSAATVAALLAGVPQLIRPADPGPFLPAASPTVPTAPAPASTGTTSRVLGNVIRTGLPTRGGEWVIWAVKIDHSPTDQPSGLPGVVTGPPASVTFGFMLGVRSPDGRLDEVQMNNETEGSDRAAGFHAVDGDMNVNGRQTLTFGYYVGDASTITGGGIQAEIRTWSVDDTVKVFWVRPGRSVTEFTAYDRNGRKLPDHAGRR